MKNNHKKYAAIGIALFLVITLVFAFTLSKDDKKKQKKELALVK